LTIHLGGGCAPFRKSTLRRKRRTNDACYKKKKTPKPRPKHIRKEGGNEGDKMFKEKQERTIPNKNEPWRKTFNGFSGPPKNSPLKIVQGKVRPHTRGAKAHFTKPSSKGRNDRLLNSKKA